MKASRPARPPTVAEDAAAPPEEGTAGLTGPEVIASYVKRLPGKPGVYRMFGEAGELLYVGKARNLKARVGSYAKIGGQTQRIARMITLTRAMEFVVTASETEALLLEANLIKKLKPRFNIILRDDKSFPLTFSFARTTKRRKSASIAGRARRRACISAPSPVPARSMRH